MIHHFSEFIESVARTSRQSKDRLDGVRQLCKEFEWEDFRRSGKGVAFGEGDDSSDRVTGKSLVFARIFLCKSITTF